ncbi:hypothetical protein Tco_0685868 [Tanacetum coccineum]
MMQQVIDDDYVQQCFWECVFESNYTAKRRRGSSNLDKKQQKLQQVVISFFFNMKEHQQLGCVSLKNISRQSRLDMAASLLAGCDFQDTILFHVYRGFIPGHGAAKCMEAVSYDTSLSGSVQYWMGFGFCQETTHFQQDEFDVTCDHSMEPTGFEIDMHFLRGSRSLLAS